MRLFKTEEERLNELVFENRNKTYGAYAIRSDYSNTMLKAYVITFSSIVLLLGSAMAYNYLNKKDAVVEIPLFTDDIITMDMDLSEMEKKTEPVHQTAIAAPNTSMPTVVTESAVTTASVDPDNQQAGLGDPTSKGSSLTSTLSSTTPSTVTADPEPEPYVPPTVTISEVMPEYEGGNSALLKFLGTNLIYPEQAKIVGKEGTVYVTFVVDENGVVRDGKVLKGIGYGCDEEALRVVSKIPKWKSAGKNGDKNVRVRFNLPISFKLK